MDVLVLILKKRESVAFLINILRGIYNKLRKFITFSSGVDYEGEIIAEVLLLCFDNICVVLLRQ